MELIKISKSEGGKDVVSARELHKALEATERFSAWFERQIQYGFELNVDYVGCKVFNALANQELEDFALTINTAEHISMVQRSEIGKRIRQYFIDFRNKKPILKSRLELAKENVAILEEMERKDLLLAEAKPKVEFFDKVIESTTELSIGEASKVLQLPYGSITLFKNLRGLGVLMHDNIPYERYIKAGWFRVIERAYLKKDNTWGISLKTVVYQKGLAGISKLLANG